VVPRPCEALGIDYGERRIGLALSDATGLLASPWKKMPNDANVGAAARRLADEVRALRADDTGLAAIVIRLPRRLRGEPNDQTARVRSSRSCSRGNHRAHHAAGRTAHELRGGRASCAT
jgi:RNase H-fold protein (predicted Holliday junction resolvase)